MPTVEEESFPRGGAVEIGKKRKHKQQHEQELFQSNRDDGESKPKKKKDRHVTLEKRVAAKKKSDKKVDRLLKKGLASVTHLQISSCPVNMLLLGCVKSVHDYYLDISLPNGLTGKVPITAICSAYTNLLQQLAKGDFTSAGELKGLKSLFRPGMVVRCKITEISNQEARKPKISLTLDPKDLNGTLVGANLKDGMVLCGGISSVEDHGYVVDLGVTGIVAFLKKKDADEYIQDYNDGEPLYIGSYLHFMISSDDKLDVMMGESRTVQVIVDPRQIFRREATKDMRIKMNTLLPGTRVSAKIRQVFDRGVQVDFLSFSGTIHRTHLMQHSGKLNVGDELTAAVLYIHPITKVISLTYNTHLLTPDLAPKKLFGNLEYGHIIEEAKVIKAETFGLYLKLGDRIVGYARAGNVSDSEVKNIPQTFPKGSTVRCRVMDFDYSDNMAIVTLKKSILERQFLKYDEIKPTDDLEVEVQAVTKGGVRVTIAKHMRGFIPNSHLADVPLKHPERRFIPGVKINARVLTVESDEKKIILTTKKSILNSKYPKITEYSQARPRMVVEGVVTKVNEKGLRVLFYNSVKGFVPPSHLSTEFIEDPAKVFYVGQVVVVQVLKSLPEEEKLVLSLKIKDKDSKNTSIPQDLEIGQLLDVVVSGKVDKGLFVESKDSKFNIQAFLPKEHLSDHMINSGLLHKMYKRGDVIQECIVLSFDKRIIVTQKPCLVSAAKDGTLVTNFEDVKLGLELPGAIRNRMDYGLFVDLPASLIGLTPVKFLLDERVPDPTTLYQIGQSVVAKVTEVDEEKRRLLLSLRLKDCYHGEVQDGVNLLHTYLKENAAIMDYHRQGGDKQTLASHCIGEVVKVTISKVTEQGALCSLSDGTQAVATDDHIREVACAVGKTFEAVVLYIDLVENCLEVSLNTSLVGHIKNYSESKYTKARTNQVIKSEVLLIKEEFVLIALKGHALGLLACLPAKKHLNDIMEKRQYQITQQNPVVVKRTTKEGVLALLQIHDPGEKERKTKTGLNHHLLPGVITKAKIKEVLDFQLNIVIGEVHGRVHISEVSDKVKEGTNPLKKFKEDQELKVKVIGYRELKTNKHLPVTHSKIWTSLPECSLKQGKLKSKGLLQSEDLQQSKFAPGDQVIVYVQSFNKNCLWVYVSPKYRGKILRHNISEDSDVQTNPLSHFKIGHAYKATVIGEGKANVLELSLVGGPTKTAISEGNNVEGTVTKSGDTGLLVELHSGYTGRVGLTDITDEYVDSPWEKYSEGDKVTVHVLKCDHTTKCILSLRPSRVSPEMENTIKDPELTVGNIEVGKLVRGFITNNTNKNKLFVSLSSQLGAQIKTDKLCEHKLKSLAGTFFVGKVICGKVIRAIKSKKKTVIQLSLLEADTGIPLDLGELADLSFDEHNIKARKRKNSETEDEDHIGVESKKSKKGKTVSKKDTSLITPLKKESQIGAENDAEVKDSVDDVDTDSDSGVEEDIRLTSPKAVPKTAPSLGFTGGFTWDSEVTLPPPKADDAGASSGSESDEETEVSEKKKKKQTRQERLAAQREEERQLVEKERYLVSADGTPQSADDYDRLVLQSPNSSLVWLAYMAYHLETTEIEKARAVAERALKTISFREEQEKLNVWVAYLNLENMYGTPELLKMVFERAVQQNDQLKVYNQLATIYGKSNKEEAADELYRTMIRRFGPLKDVWINYGLFLFKCKKEDEARKLMQRSLKSLEQKYHLEVLSKFAQMEYKHGEPERGRTMFENILSSYPGRTDLWSVYIDMTIKQGQHQQVRNIFQRVSTLKLSAKKMKFFFKKQLDFEQKHGNEETVATVKQQALEYVQARTSLT